MLYIGMPQIDVVGAINFVKFDVRFPFANLGSKASSACCPISCVSAPDVELLCALTVNWKLGFNLHYLVQDRILFLFSSEGDVHQIFTAASQQIPAKTEDTKTQGTTRTTVKRSRADSRPETKPLGQRTDHSQPRDGQIMDPETSSMTKGSTTVSSVLRLFILHLLF